MNDCSSIDDTVSQSQSENSTKDDPSPCSESADGSRENKDNNSTHEAPRKKLINIFDSDSEKEDDFISSLLNKSYAEESSRPLESENKISDLTRSGRGSRRLIDSDSEEENSVNPFESANYGNEDSCNENESSEETATKKKTISSIVDSTSDDEEGNSATRSSTVKNKKVASNRKKKDKADKKIVKSNKISSLIDTDSEDDGKRGNVDETPRGEQRKTLQNPAKETEKSAKRTKSNNISSLIDTDSEDDGKRGNFDETPREEQHKTLQNPAKETEKSAKKRTGSIRASKDEAMRQIHSETQRLIRSSEVSLPYHRPKQRSLQEFLNRKKFIPALPEGLTTAAKVKMCSEIVGKVLEEKEREAELFYKSSDSEDDEATGSAPANPQDENKGSSSGTFVDHSSIEDTQRILKNDVQNAHNKKEIIQQGTVDLGVPRKLFSIDTEDSSENKPTEMEHNNEDASELEDPRKKTKETRHGIREASMPRKLFGNDYEEASAPSNRRDAIATDSQSSEIVGSNYGTADSPISENASRSIVDGDGTDMTPNLQDAPSKKIASDLDAMACRAGEESAEFSMISDTPFISNKEIAKFNEIAKASRESVGSDEKLIEDDGLREPVGPIGHVFGLPPPDFDSDDLRTEKITNMKRKLQSGVGPKLRGAPGTFIDLSDDVKPNREGVQSLVDRFIRHSATNKSAEVSSSVKVLHVEKTEDGPRVVEEILPYKLPSSDVCNDKELAKPGAKYHRLKRELIEKMAQKRGEEWRLKEQREKDESLDEDEEIEDESDGDAEEQPLQEEFEASGESEPEEEDMPPETKIKRKINGFADEEAEVSGEENNEEDEEMEINENNTDDEENENSGKEDAADDDDVLSDAEDEPQIERKRPSRIVKAFEDDSTSSLPETSLPSGIVSRENAFERTKTDVDMFSPDDENDGWLSDTEAELPPSQLPPRDSVDGRSQLCKTPLTAVDVLRFVSPITQLTAFDSCTDSPKDGLSSKGTPGPIRRFVDSSAEKTPVAVQSPISFDSEKRNGFQKKLFEDHAGTVNDEELMDLCSGKFTGMENCDNGESHGKVSESQSSMGIHSELFEKGTPIVDETSQDIRLALDGDSDDSRDKLVGKKSTTESKTPWTNFKIASSSDDEDCRENRGETNGRRKKLTKKKIKKLELSDEEEEASESQDEEELEILDEDKEVKYVDYDSEENEVVVVPKKDIKKVAAGFLDEEAELSESEWGSADEDERDSDRLEFEAGDDEEIDENQMRDQLGKIHVRQVLDDDQREVRMLQELLFDDGDLHTEGSGRERQFKWKNIDNLGDDEKLDPRNDDLDENGDAIEEDNDLEWRKQRYERDKYIEDNKKTNSDDIANEELESDSQILKLGMKALEKSKSNHSSGKKPDAALTKKPHAPRTVLDLFGDPTTCQYPRMLNKTVNRGSFLTRGDECLARLAVRANSEITITNRKNPRNFVFAHISPAVAGTANKDEIDVTNVDSPADTKTKKRKPPDGVTPRTAKKAKIEVTRSTGKKLF